jgi:hypothetical protein
MKTFALALLCAATLAFAGQFRVGTRFVLDLSSSGTNLPDTNSQYVGNLTYDDMYYGLGFTAEYAPLSWLSVRASLAEARLLMQGGFALALFPTLGGDVIIEPPVKWRVVPHVRFGGTWTGYVGINDTHDTRSAFPTDYSLRFGFGARYRLTDRINLEADTNIWGEETEYVAGGGIVGQGKVGWIGLGQAHLGVTFLVPSP